MRKAVQRCRECRTEMALEEAIWMDDSGSFHDEEGEGRPFCLDCVAVVEERLHNEAARLRRIQERRDAFLLGPNGVALTIMGAGRTGVAAGTAARPGFVATSGSGNSVESQVQPSTGVTDPGPPSEVVVVERLVEAEQRFGIRIQGLNIKVDDDGDVRVLGEVVPAAGSEFAQDVAITFIAYDAEGQVMTVASHPIQSGRAFAVEPLSLWLFTNAAPSRIRVFPRSP